jgi:hypothetical protein
MTIKTATMNGALVWLVPGAGRSHTIHKTLDDAEWQQNANMLRERNKAERQAEQAEQAAQSERDKRAMEAHGFFGPMTAIKRARVIATLNRTIRVNGTLGTRMDLIEKLVCDGYRVVHCRGRRELTIGERFLIESDITKTGMDYAEYLGQAG